MRDYTGVTLKYCIALCTCIYHLDKIIIYLLEDSIYDHIYPCEIYDLFVFRFWVTKV